MVKIAKVNVQMKRETRNFKESLKKMLDEHKDKVRLFLEFATQAKINEVPDPYYGGLHGFETVLDLVEDASLGLLKHIKNYSLVNK